MTWSKKHDEFCLQCKLRPSTRLMLRWILRRAKLNEVSEIEVDLRVFNSWVEKKRGTAYDRKTIREAIDQLDESTQGLVLISKTYSPWVKKLIVRPLSLVTEKKPRKTGTIPRENSLNPMYSDVHKKRDIEQQQQNISKLDALFTKVGLKYDRDALQRIWKLAGKSMANIVQSMEFLLFRHSTQEKPIKNPQGFLIECLKHKWHQDFNLYYQVELPYFDSGEKIGNFVRSLLPDKNPLYQT